MTGPDYWNMTDAEIAAAWTEVDAANLDTDYDGTVVERLNFVEDAILQRIGAPDDASGDDPAWQDLIREWAQAHEWKTLAQSSHTPPQTQ